MQRSELLFIYIYKYGFIVLLKWLINKTFNFNAKLNKSKVVQCSAVHDTVVQSAKLCSLV